MAPFKVFKLKVDREDYEESLTKIAVDLRPAWDKDKIHIKEFKDGVIHKVLHCYHGDSSTQDDSLVFRIFPNDDLYIYIEGDEHQVVMNQQIANRSGNGPELLATFANGTVSSYVKGTTMKNSDFKNIDVIKQLTDHIARLHTVDLDSEFYDFHGKPMKYEGRLKFIEVIRHLFEIQDIPTTCRDPEKKALLEKYFKEDDLRRDTDFAEEFIRRANLPLCHSHYDLHKNNLIIDRESGKITLIDFDVGGLMFECTDIASFWKGDSVADDRSDDDIPAGLSEEEFQVWIRCYLEAKNKQLGKEGEEVPDWQIRKFRIQCEMVNTLTSLSPSIWALNGFEDFTLYDSFGLALASRKTFLSGKSKLDELLLEYQALG